MQNARLSIICKGGRSGLQPLSRSPRSNKTGYLCSSGKNRSILPWTAKVRLNRPVEVDGQRTSALRTTDLRVLALWHLQVWFRLLPCDFANRDLREQLAVLTRQSPNMITQ